MKTVEARLEQLGSVEHWEPDRVGGTTVERGSEIDGSDRAPAAAP